jgi:hypothetical protein
MITITETALKRIVELKQSSGRHPARPRKESLLFRTERACATRADAELAINRSDESNYENVSHSHLRIGRRVGSGR